VPVVPFAGGVGKEGMEVVAANAAGTAARAEGGDEGEEFANMVRYRWVQSEALVGWKQGVIDVYNSSDVLSKSGLVHKGRCGEESGQVEEGEGEVVGNRLVVGVIFRDVHIDEPGVYRLVAKGPEGAVVPSRRSKDPRDKDDTPVFYNGLGSTRTFLVAAEGQGSEKGAETMVASGKTGGRTSESGGTGLKVIAYAYSKHGPCPVSMTVASVKQARLVYGAAWIVVVLVDATVGAEERDQLEAGGARVVDADGWVPAAAGNMRWSFWPLLLAEKLRAEDIGEGGGRYIERFLVRAVGYSVLERERDAVQEWERSGRTLHLMRDSKYHKHMSVVPHLWGCKMPCSPLRAGSKSASNIPAQSFLATLVRKFLDKQGAHVRTDGWFMRTSFYPWFDADDVLAHDSGRT
jgi:hypothetical protein